MRDLILQLSKSSIYSTKPYEIASYGTLVTLAEQLGYKKAAKLLAETLEEEKQTDVKLTDLAVGNINKKAEK